MGPGSSALLLTEKNDCAREEENVLTRVSEESEALEVGVQGAMRILDVLNSADLHQESGSQDPQVRIHRLRLVLVRLQEGCHPFHETFGDSLFPAYRYTCI